MLARSDARTTRVDSSVIFDALHDVTRRDLAELRAQSARLGNPGDLAGELLAGRLPSGIAVNEVAEWGSALASAADSARRPLVRDMLARLSGLEAQYFVALICGELCIGLDESQVEEAIAEAFRQPVEAVREANRLRGDIGEVARLARRRELATV
jgi:DNA ligase-1